MSTFIILREEILCLVVLAVLNIYTRDIKKTVRGASFGWIWAFAMMHVIFDAITVITVNMQEVIPESLNLILHFCYTTTAIWFCYEVCVYTSALIYPISFVKKLKTTLVWVPITYMLIVWIFPIKYGYSGGTYYATGPFVVCSFAVGFLLMGLTGLMLLVHHRRINKIIRRFVVFTFSILLATAIVQVFETEILFTGATCTILTLGIFFVVENPMTEIQERAYIDMFSGLKNRNCYIDESKELTEKYLKNGDTKIGIIYADLNHLKMVNDTYGHAAGDDMIRTTALVLSKNLSTAYNVYRMGGDEFLAVYVNPNSYLIDAEITNVHAELQEVSKAKDIPFSISIGYCESCEKTETIHEIVELADMYMYKNKKKMESA